MIKKIVLILPFLFSAMLLAQETSYISGKVLDNELNGEPMLFADVALKNTRWKTQTNFHGNFEIDGVDPGSYVLVISFLGYDTIEIPIEAKPNGVLQIQKGLSSKTIDPEAVIASNSEPQTYGSIALTERQAQK